MKLLVLVVLTCMTCVVVAYGLQDGLTRSICKLEDNLHGLQGDTEIRNDDELPDIMLKVARGNLKALNIVGKYIDSFPAVFPNLDFSPIWMSSEFNIHGITGEHIITMYHNVCNSCIDCMDILMMAMDLNEIRHNEVYCAISAKQSILIEPIATRVRIHLEVIGFGPVNVRCQGQRAL